MRSHKLGKPFSFKDLLLLGLALSLLFVAGSIHHRSKKPEINLTKQDTATNINGNLLTFFSVGNKRMLADMIWVQTLLESDLDRYSGPANLNWMFLRFKTIAKLDPLFYENYAWGGQYLSIIKDDLIGGVELLKDGLEYYPDDFKLNYLLGFSYYYELNDYDKGLGYLEKVMNHPKAPYYLKTIVYKMKIEKGFDLDSGVELLKNQLEQTQEGDFRSKLLRDFYSLKAERDLKCLNNKKEGCDRVDSEGKPYLYIKGKYRTYRPFTPYRLIKKGDNTKAIQVDIME